MERDERGAVLVLVVLSTTALLTIAAMVIDGSRIYALRRQMQNAADAAALAGARALDRYQRHLISDPTAVSAAAGAEATANGAAPLTTCTLVDFNLNALASCPTSVQATIPAAAAGVTVQAQQSQANLFAVVVHMSTFTAAGTATAEIGKPGGGDAPFMLCASDPQDQGIAALTLQNGSYAVNPAAIGKTYSIWGNAIKQYDCGDGSNSFRGLVDQGSGPFAIPGSWPNNPGNKTGPTVQLIDSGTPCDANYNTGCVLAVPLCPYASSSGLSGKNFALYCTDFGMFQVVSQSPPQSIKATFLGPGVLVNTTGGISGPADPNGGRVIQLTN